MGKIKILSDDLVNKIAAGEVVERPASIVKELVENAFDAKASSIRVEVEEGGTKRILVTDNGEGMDKDDVKECVKRHGTSKISTLDDLLQISSYGFRGEALSSISAVSELTIKSKPSTGVAGTTLFLKGGIPEYVSSVGMPQGTSIRVDNLFYNVPARKKFLKNPATELRHIADIVTDNAFSHPEIGFLLSHNKKPVFDLSERQTLEERIRSLLGEQVSISLVPVFFDHPHLHISGYITKPQTASETKYRQYTFVNGRRVRDMIVAKAVREAYGPLLPHTSNPIFLLFLTLPFDSVDVNVHPRKEEVKFINTSFIYTAVRNAVSHALQKEDLTFIGQFPSKTHIDLPATKFQDEGKADSFAQPRPITLFQEKRIRISDAEMDALFEEKLVVQKQDVLQVHNLYLITQTPKGILLLDQHAAHERILYEHFVDLFQKEKKNRDSQILLVPLTFDLPFGEATILKENLETFRILGFDIEEFGKNSFKMTAVPTVLQERPQLDLTKLINEVISDFIQEKPIRDVDQRSLKVISYLSCRSAVKAGDPLNIREREEIVTKLLHTKTLYTCPHGRPVKMEVTLQELGKLFKRL
ncbi:MAG TPA: DNA mismatch repair endonuclease MutL [Patescibacteria group bacterium]|nr:DNA mismatch repair endonuclease MutL [Patescibacteria group bacterium]